MKKLIFILLLLPLGLSSETVIIEGLDEPSTPVVLSTPTQVDNSSKKPSDVAPEDKTKEETVVETRTEKEILEDNMREIKLNFHRLNYSQKRGELKSISSLPKLERNQSTVEKSTQKIKNKSLRSDSKTGLAVSVVSKDSEQMSYEEGLILIKSYVEDSEYIEIKFGY